MLSLSVMALFVGQPIRFNCHFGYPGASARKMIGLLVVEGAPCGACVLLSSAVVGLSQGPHQGVLDGVPKSSTNTFEVN